MANPNGNPDTVSDWRKKLISYTGDPRWQDKPGMKKKKFMDYITSDPGIRLSDGPHIWTSALS